MSARHVYALGAAVVFSTAAGGAPPTCGAPGMDLAIGDIQQAIGSFATADEASFRIGVTFCNFGDQAAAWQASTSHHPVFGTNLFRLVTVPGGLRMEQVGQAWVRHEFSALAQAHCCTCTPMGDGTLLGPGCSSVTSAGSGTTLSLTGPKWQVNPWTGEFAYPAANPPAADAAARQLRVRYDELAGEAFFFEAQAVSADEPAANRANNVSYRRATLMPGDVTIFVSFSGATARGEPAIAAWAGVDPLVRLVSAEVPGDGRVFVASRAARLPGGNWRYEYTVQNVNCDRAIGRVRVAGCVDGLTNAGFRAVAYHDGDGLPTNAADPNGSARNFSNADWAFAASAGGAEWSTDPFATDPNANAIRWGTMDNFWFESPVAPAVGALELGLFKPGTPDAVMVSGLDVPIPCPCLADFDGSGALGLQDLFAFLTAYFSGDLRADLDASGALGVEDIFRYLVLYFSGC